MPRILVVDDEQAIADLIAIHLRNEGYEVTTVYDGEEALCLVAETGFDLLILDIMMPGMDGLEICRRVRESATSPLYFLVRARKIWTRYWGSAPEPTII